MRTNSAGFLVKRDFLDVSQNELNSHLEPRCEHEVDQGDKCFCSDANGYYIVTVFFSASPTLAICLLIPFTPRGSVDALARGLQHLLEATFGASTIFADIDAAGESICTNDINKTLTNRHRMVMVFDTHAINRYPIQSLSFDRVRYFISIMLIATTSLVPAARAIESRRPEGVSINGENQYGLLAAPTCPVSKTGTRAIERRAECVAGVRALTIKKIYG